MNKKIEKKPQQVISGLRTEVRLYVAGFVVALGVFGVVADRGFSKMDGMETKIDTMSGKLDTLIATADETNSTLNAMSGGQPSLPVATEPNESVFVDWKGIMVKDPNSPQTVKALQTLDTGDSPVWIYFKPPGN